MIDIDKLPNVEHGFLSYKGKSPVNNAWEEFNKDGRVPLQWVADKYGKNHAWKVIKTKWDFDAKAIKFTLLVNADESKDVLATYEDICKEMNWKSFKVINACSCVPVEMGMDEISEIYAKAVAKTKVEDNKWFKEHPEGQEKKVNEAKA